MGEQGYYMLVASLPRLPGLFAARRTPISRLRLDQRLAMLTETHAAQLRSIEDLLQWERLPLELGDAELLERVNVGIEVIAFPDLRTVVRERFELRTLVAALRRRQAGREPPRRGELWGHGRWLESVHRNWQHPTFGLEAQLPWLRELAAHATAGATRAFERAALGVAWAQLTRIAERHHFDFEAVVLYVLRFELVARWTSYEAGPAEERFGDLVEAGLDGVRELLADPRTSDTA